MNVAISTLVKRQMFILRAYEREIEKNRDRDIPNNFWNILQ